MTQRYLQPNNNNTQWFLRANTIIGNSNENLNINLQSDNSLNKVIFKIGNNTTDFGNQYLKVPQGSTDQRPTSNLYSGYLRFNTTLDVLEYFSSTTNSWNSISVPPTITSVSPTFIDVNDPSFVINGSNFGPNPKVEAIGSDGTSFEMTSVSVNGINTIINTTLTGTNVIDNSNLEPFDIKVTNTSGLSFLFDDAIDINDTPIFTTFGGQTINTIINISGGFDVTGTGLLDISAVDNDPEHTISFTSSNLQSSGGSLVIDSNTGQISGSTPNLNSTTNVNFSVSANDGFSTSTQTFTYKIIVPQELSFSITSGDSPNVTTLYLDSGGNPTGNGLPDLNGYTIYSIKTSDAIAPGQTTIGNFTSNVDINNLSFVLVGGGGGGGSGNSGSALGAGGGGGGGLVVGTNQTLTSGQAYNFQVGKGGLGTKGPAFGSSFNSRLVYGQTDVEDDFNPITSGTYIARNGEDSFINVGSGTSVEYRGKGGGFAGTRNYPFLESEGVTTDASGIRGSGGIGGSGGGCGSTSVDQIGDGGPAKPGTSNQDTYGGTANITGYGNRGGQLVSNTNWFATGGGGAGETGQDAERAQVNSADTSYGTDGGDGVGVSNSILTTTTATQLGIGEIENNLVYFAGGGGAGGMDSFNGTGVNEANPNGGLGRPGGLGGGGDGRGYTQSDGNFVAPVLPPEESQSNYGNGNPGINGTGGGGGGSSAFNDSYAESWVSATYVAPTLNESITSYWNSKSTSDLPILNSGGDGGSGVLLIKIQSYKTI